MLTIDEKINELKDKNIFRTIKNTSKKFAKHIVFEGKEMLNLSSNDYLNLKTKDELEALIARQ